MEVLQLSPNLSSSFKDSIGSANFDRRNHPQFIRTYTNHQNEMKSKIGDVFLTSTNLNKQEDNKMHNFITNQIFCRK